MPDFPNSAIAAASLCFDCGACCTGRLHNHVKIYGDEADHIRKTGIPLKTHTDGMVYFQLPCKRVRNNLCTIHENKPKICANFLCGLQKKVMADRMTFEDASAIIQTFKAMGDELIAQSKNGQSTPPRLNLWSHLRDRMEELEQIIEERAFTNDEMDFIEAAFEYSKLQDRYFSETRLYRGYADLIMKAWKPNI